MIHDIISPLAPVTDETTWLDYGDIRQTLQSAYPTHLWRCPRFLLTVISAVEVATDTDGVTRGPEYHLSVTRNDGSGPQRCSKEQAYWMLQQFGGLDGWEEDNHVPNGKARNFWRPVAENMVGHECGCKATESVVIEGDYESRPLEAS